MGEDKTSNVLAGREFNSAAVLSDRSRDADERWGGRWLQVGGSGGLMEEEASSAWVPYGGGLAGGTGPLGPAHLPGLLCAAAGRLSAWGGRTPHVQVHAFT